MVTIHLQVGVLAENSLSWTLLSLGLYHDLEANQGMIFHTSTWQLHRGKKSILSRKEDCFLGSMIQRKAKPEQEILDRLILYHFFKENFSVNYCPKSCQSDCCRSTTYGFMIYFSSSGNIVCTCLKDLGIGILTEHLRKHCVMKHSAK